MKQNLQNSVLDDFEDPSKLKLYFAFYLWITYMFNSLMFITIIKDVLVNICKQE